MYIINTTSKFDRKFKKLIKQNIKLKTLFFTILEIITLDPFASTLRTHKVQTIEGKVRWSSRINGDLRIIWDFDGNNVNIIDLFDIGGHTGKNKVYK